MSQWVATASEIKRAKWRARRDSYNISLNKHIVWATSNSRIHTHTHTQTHYTHLHLVETACICWILERNVAAPIAPGLAVMRAMTAIEHNGSNCQ